MHRHITTSELRKHQKELFDDVCENHVSLFASRPNGKDVVILSAEDYWALNETAYLLASKKNRTRLKKALSGKGKEFKTLSEMEASLDL